MANFNHNLQFSTYLLQLPVRIIPAEPKHAPQIWQLIRELAIYERAENEHVVTKEQLALDLEQKTVFGYVAVNEQDVVIGTALLCWHYSTWKGRGLYLDDLVVSESHRRSGVGRQLLETVILFAQTQNVGRLQWQVLDWNTPAIEFYRQYKVSLENTWINVMMAAEDVQDFTPTNSAIPSNHESI